VIPLIVLLAACDSGPVALTAPDAWAWEQDGGAFADSRPPDLDCAFDPFVVEDELIEIRTADCGHVTLTTVTLVPLRAGDAVELVLQNGPLTADEDGEATVVLTIDGLVALERSLPIPSAGAFHSETWTADAVPAGADVVFHARNHGVNAYRLNRLERVR